MPHERFPSARPRWFTSNPTPCRVDGDVITLPPQSEKSPHGFITFSLSDKSQNPFHETLWSDVVDLRSRHPQLSHALASEPLNLTIDHYRHAEWLIDAVAQMKPAHPIHAWVQVSTPDSFGGMRAGNDATDLAHGAHQLFTQHRAPISVRGFITTIEIVSSLEQDRILQRDQRLLERTLNWAASEDKSLQALQQLPSVPPPLNATTTFTPGIVIATVVSRPSLEVGIIDLGCSHLGQTSALSFPDHHDIKLTRIGSMRAELHLDYNAQNLRIGDQLRVQP
ncbi:hypothetical protein [Lacunimicrobium album]